MQNTSLSPQKPLLPSPICLIPLPSLSLHFFVLPFNKARVFPYIQHVFVQSVCVPVSKQLAGFLVIACFPTVSMFICSPTPRQLPYNQHISSQTMCMRSCARLWVLTCDCTCHSVTRFLSSTPVLHALVSCPNCMFHIIMFFRPPIVLHMDCNLWQGVLMSSQQYTGMMHACMYVCGRVVEAGGYMGVSWVRV